jgi:predicted enzyme related to lactoylglutathione lyase
MSNHVIFFEVVGKDGAALRSFYRELFGWSVSEVPGDMDYGMVASADAGIDGGIGATPDGGPGHTTFYVESPNPQGTLDRAEQLGAKTLLKPTELPGGGVIALVADPEGHTIGLYRPAQRASRPR